MIVSRDSYLRYNLHSISITPTRLRKVNEASKDEHGNNLIGYAGTASLHSIIGDQRYIHMHRCIGCDVPCLSDGYSFEVGSGVSRWFIPRRLGVAMLMAGERALHPFELGCECRNNLRDGHSSISVFFAEEIYGCVTCNVRCAECQLCSMILRTG